MTFIAGVTEAGNSFMYAHDSAGRKTSEVASGISTNSFAYDASSSLLKPANLS